MNSNIKVSATIAAIILGFGVSSAPVLADAHRGKGDRPSFAELDVNGDGQISADDLQAHAAARFAQVDSDGDGVLSAAELSARASERAGKRAERMIEKLDSDGDGGLSMEELAQSRMGQRGARMIEKLDSDGDGSVSQAEYDAAKSKMGRRGKHSDRDDN